MRFSILYPTLLKNAGCHSFTNLVSITRPSIHPPVCLSIHTFTFHPVTLKWLRQLWSDFMSARRADNLKLKRQREQIDSSITGTLICRSPPHECIFFKLDPVSMLPQGIRYCVAHAQVQVAPVMWLIWCLPASCCAWGRLPAYSKLIKLCQMVSYKEKVSKPQRELW